MDGLRQLWAVCLICNYASYRIPVDKPELQAMLRVHAVPRRPPAVQPPHFQRHNQDQESTKFVIPFEDNPGEQLPVQTP